MFHKNKFRAAIVEQGETLQGVANALNINISTLHRKMNGTSEFNRSEIQTLCEFLNLESPMDIFFNDKIA